MIKNYFGTCTPFGFMKFKCLTGGIFIILYVFICCLLVSTFYPNRSISILIPLRALLTQACRCQQQYLSPHQKNVNLLFQLERTSSLILGLLLSLPICCCIIACSSWLSVNPAHTILLFWKMLIKCFMSYPFSSVVG